MARNGNAPKVLERSTEKGVPMIGLFLAFVIGLIAFLPCLGSVPHRTPSTTTSRPHDRTPRPRDGDHRYMSRLARHGGWARILEGKPLEDEIDLIDVALLVEARVLRRNPDESLELAQAHPWHYDPEALAAGTLSVPRRALDHAEGRTTDWDPANIETVVAQGLASTSAATVVGESLLPRMPQAFIPRAAFLPGLMAIHRALRPNRWLVLLLAAAPSGADSFQRAIQAHGAHLTGGGPVVPEEVAEQLRAVGLKTSLKSARASRRCCSPAIRAEERHRHHRAPRSRVRASARL